MKAWELIQDPKNWTKGAYARDANGQQRDPASPDATCWCAVGACRKSYTFEERHALYEKLRAHIPKRFSIMDWNDVSDHATVLAKLKELDI